MSLPDDAAGRDRSAATDRVGLGRDTTSLAFSAGVSGIAAYAFAAIGTRALGAHGFAPVSVLWTFWAVTTAAVSFPVQHWVIRQFRVDGSEAGVRDALPRIALASTAIAAAVGVIGWVARGSLFGRTDAAFPVFLGLVPLGAALMGLLRGALAGRGRFAGCAWALSGENLIRFGLAIAGAALGWGATAFGAILIGGFAIVIAWPTALQFRDEREAGRPPLGQLMGMSGGSVLAQLVLTGGPVAVAVTGGSPTEVTSLFAALALLRAPYVLATGVATRLTGLLTGLVVEGRTRTMLRFQLMVGVGVGIAAILASGFAWAAGPRVLQILFGSDIEVGAGTVAIIGVGTAFALGTLMQTLVLISRARADLIVGSWALALVVAVGWVGAGPGAPLARASWGFLIGEAIAFFTMVVVEAQGLREPARATSPDQVSPYIGEA